MRQWWEGERLGGWDLRLRVLRFGLCSLHGCRVSGFGLSAAGLI